MAAEHRRRHKAHLDQHVKDVSGEYHYVGDWYVLSGGKTALAPFALWCALTSVLVVSAGCVDFPGLRNTWYVILPYVFTVGMLVGLGFQAVRLISGGGRLKTFDWERTKDKVVPFAGALLLFAALTAALGGVYLALSRAQMRAADAIFFVPLVLSGVCACMAIRAFRAQAWQLEHGKSDFHGESH